jgi:voltage-gated potassium channel
VTLTIALGFLILAAFLISGLDPAFEDPIDGFWWAWVTMTTVGYGDLVPTTLEGRIVGMLLILVGIAIFSMLTASFSVFFIEKEEEEKNDREDAVLRRLQLLEARLERIELNLNKAVTSLEQIQTLESEKRSPKN